MVEIARYSAIKLLANGAQIEIRALRPDDRPDFFAALARTSAGSLYRRFFSTRRDFTAQEAAFFLNVDFVTQVALVAVVAEAERQSIVGAGRYIVTRPKQAEVAFVVIDQYQGQGIGQALIYHLAAIARQSGIKELFAEVLADNIAMLKVFEKSGHAVRMQRAISGVTVTLRLE